MKWAETQKQQEKSDFFHYSNENVSAFIADTFNLE